ncbi:hypothetical protein A4X13_0g1206 [Tilletia indica]|uniref:Uncharacterized protein n=1 Tax=Tilletia indica TaxID=43049 RepID=A0A177T9I5_9BASI|nr:hypothetical protein A4X13_0g1206 [Tilletia indica]
MQSLSVTCPVLSGKTAERWTSTIPVPRNLRMWKFGCDRGARINLARGRLSLQACRPPKGSKIRARRYVPCEARDDV